MKRQSGKSCIYSRSPWMAVTLKRIAAALQSAARAPRSKPRCCVVRFAVGTQEIRLRPTYERLMKSVATLMIKYRTMRDSLHRAADKGY